MNKTLTASVIVLCIASSHIAIANHAVQVGRYSSIEAGATRAQINPLEAVVSFHFPPSVQTVGGAINMLLDNTGYRLAPISQLSPQAQNTLKMPLPVIDRTLGPIPVANALRVLMGQSVYRLEIDPLLRTVNFVLLPLFRPAVSDLLPVKSRSKNK